MFASLSHSGQVTARGDKGALAPQHISMFVSNVTHVEWLGIERLLFYGFLDNEFMVKQRATCALCIQRK